jgi:hypothetical protein
LAASVKLAFVAFLSRRGECDVLQVGLIASAESTNQRWKLVDASSISAALRVPSFRKLYLQYRRSQPPPIEYRRGLHDAG